MNFIMENICRYALLLSLVISTMLSASAQYGYSDFAESLMAEVTDSSLSLLDRQLSGDTTVLIGGVLDSIITRHSSYAGNAKAAQFILEKFQSFGLAAEYQQYNTNGYNVVATKIGTVYPNEQYIICAHYDDMPNGPLAPGADDNGSGTSAVIEAARVLTPYSFDYTLKFIAFDEEEQGLFGSKAYADTAYKYGAMIKGVLNLDMISWDSNNDYEISLASNVSSMPLLADYTDILRIFQPLLSPHLINIPNSDHSSFWNRGYPALLTIEEYPGDFHAYYHTVNDLFQYVNLPFFLAITRGTVAAMATLGRNYRMNLSHQPLSNNLYTDDRTANLLVTSPHPIDTGIYKPRLYYRIDDSSFNFINAFQISGDTFKFSIPGQPPGTKISYYFAAQDIDGEFSVTLPESGRGVNPPGLVPPPVYYSYYVLNSTTVNLCASGLSMSIPANQIVNKVLNIPDAGRLLDVNVNLSISHTYIRDINLYLVSPSGREVILSTKNGFSLDHYSNTFFDDEAITVINQDRPPYTDSFRPEQPLALFDDTVTNGNWTLKIRNAGSTIGTLTKFCLIFTYADNVYYVDASNTDSTNGLSWQTAFNSISEAADLVPAAGSVVLIKPGTYNEAISITSNGQEITPVITGVSLSDGNKIQFPSSTNLSGIDLTGHPGEYYAFVFRSRNFNNGFYQVNQVNDGGDYILVNGQTFRDETGSAGDSSVLSAAVCRPVIYRKYASQPEIQRVIVNADNNEDISTILYLGDAIGDGAYDALPADYNIVDGIDLTGSVNGGGVHIQGSSFNVIASSLIYETNGAGVLIDGNADHPACYNFIINNEIYNSPAEGIYIGAGGMPEYNNYTHYTHLLGNNIHTSGSGINAILENAIDIKEHNKGTFIEKNLVHDFNLVSSGNGAVDINSRADKTVLNGNIFRNIGKTGEGVHAIIMVHEEIQALDIFNNIIFDSLFQDNDIYALRIDATGHGDSRVAHNTIYNTDNGFLLEDYASEPVFGIHNNIVHINNQYFTHWGAEGRYQVSNNYYNEDPTPQTWMPYYGETGRQVGEISFVNPSAGNFRLVIGDDLLICNGLSLSEWILYDADKKQRDTDQPDIGAFELENKIIWTGSTDQNWSTITNWNLNTLPVNNSNVVIIPAQYQPHLDINHVVIRGVLLKQGSSLTIPPYNTIEQHQAGQ
jgi:subtilisin-like proprotein convertase family protein